jgi:IrrE N-terminal-like domain
MSSVRQDIPEARAREIIKLAESIADKHYPTGQVDPEAITPEEIELVYDHYSDEFDGKLEYENGKFSIHCNLDWGNLPGSPRGRYTVSHELGHYFIPSHRNALIIGQTISHPSFADNQPEDSLMEREANLFASHLLMPTARFKAALPRARKGLGGIIDLAAKFKVSLTCVAIRYVVDEVEPSVVIKWLPERVEWKWLSWQFRARNFSEIVTDIRALPKNSPTQMCVSAGQTQSGVIDSKVAAATWFRNMPPPHDLAVLEEAMTLGRFGGLTLLTLPDGCFPQ